MGCMTMIDVELMTDAEKDPAGHEPFTQIAATVTQLKLTLLGGSIVIEGDGNWIEVSGSIGEDGNVSASGTGEAAGFTGVSALFEGTIMRDETGMPVSITGNYTVGGNGALPGGEPVIYMVMGGEPPAPSAAMVTVGDNFFDPSSVTVVPGGTVTWTWAGSDGHNVTFDTTELDNAPTQATGTHQVTMPTTAGVYNYECTIHAGMEGSVTVQ
jgi:plastocyanin